VIRGDQVWGGRGDGFDRVMPVVRSGSGSRGRPVVGEKSEAVLSLPGGDSETCMLPELFGELGLVSGDDKDVEVGARGNEEVDESRLDMMR